MRMNRWEVRAITYRQYSLENDEGYPLYPCEIGAESAQICDVYKGSKNFFKRADNLSSKQLRSLTISRGCDGGALHCKCGFSVVNIGPAVMSEGATTS